MNIKDEYKKQIIAIDGLLDNKENLTNKQIDNLLYFRSNLLFGYKWMDKCHEPGVYQGIDNLKARQAYRTVN